MNMVIIFQGSNCCVGYQVGILLPGNVHARDRGIKHSKHALDNGNMVNNIGHYQFVNKLMAV